MSEERVVARCSVDLDAVKRSFLATDGEVTGAGRVADDAGSKGREIEKVAAVGRQVNDLLLIDRRRERRPGRFDNLLSCGRNVDDGRAATDLQRYIKRRLSIRSQERGPMARLKISMDGKPPGSRGRLQGYTWRKPITD